MPSNLAAYFLMLQSELLGTSLEVDGEASLICSAVNSSIISNAAMWVLYFERLTLGLKIGNVSTICSFQSLIPQQLHLMITLENKYQKERTRIEPTSMVYKKPIKVKIAKFRLKTIIFATCPYASIETLPIQPIYLGKLEDSRSMQLSIKNVIQSLDFGSNS